MTLKRRNFRSLRSYFVTGLLVWLPLLVTIYVVLFGFNLLDDLLGDVVAYFAGRHIKGAGLILLVLVTFTTGILTANLIGRHMWERFDRMMSLLPLAGNVYVTMKQLMNAFTSPERDLFRQAVMVEYPREGAYSVGFLTNRKIDVIRNGDNVGKISVFIPTALNPTSGFFIMAPKDKVRPLAISIPEAFKMVVSGGVLVPLAERSEPSEPGGAGNKK